MINNDVNIDVSLIGVGLTVSNAIKDDRMTNCLWLVWYNTTSSAVLVPYSIF